ncbi:MAG: DUF4157 domain-containing protein [Deltaproteobacteria bacterium]|nr:DUF4157 domain-containing protein [Deltaproteobacteria bacterium]
MHRYRERTDGASSEPGRATAPGRKPLTLALRGGQVQRRASLRPPSGARELDLDPGSSSALIQDVASSGIAGASSALPFLADIQASFGHHDVRHVKAHLDASAAAAAANIGARAYATGDHVAFDGAPDLHTAAHEAAHVVQQRAGVHLVGGVGAAGDRYEAHADAVADLVVQGRPAAALLDQLAGSGAMGGAVQRKVKGFPYVEVKQVPHDVIDAVMSDGGFPGGLNAQQLDLLRDLINERREYTVVEVRQRLRMFGPLELPDDHDPFDHGRRGKERHPERKNERRPEREKEQHPEREKEKEKESEKESEKERDRSTPPRMARDPGSADAGPDVDGLHRFQALLRRAPPTLLKEMLPDINYFASNNELDVALAREMVLQALEASMRPVEELIEEIAGMDRAEVDDLALCLHGQGSGAGSFLLDGFAIDGHAPQIAQAIAQQQELYDHYQDLDPDTAATLLDAPQKLLSDLADRHGRPAWVVEHVRGILRQVIAESLARARTAKDLPRNATWLLSSAQPIDDSRILRPGEITTRTCAHKFARIAMFCSIDGAEPVCTGRDRERVLDGKSVEAHVGMLMADECEAPILEAATPIKIAQSMVVPGLGAFWRVSCEHGLRWVDQACVKILDFDYERPVTGEGDRVQLFGKEGHPTAEHVRQGGLGNCYLMAALISVVSQSPHHLTDMLCELDDETVAVRFFVLDPSTRTRVATWIRVNRRVVMRDGCALFARADRALWPALVEKAYGECGGGLEATGEGGHASAAFSMILGRDASMTEIANPSRRLDEDHLELQAVPVHPLFMTAEKLSWYFKLDAGQAKDFVTQAEAARQVLEQSIGMVEDRGSVVACVERIVLALRLDVVVAKRLIDYVKKHVPSCGVTGGAYSTRAQMLHASMQSAMARGAVVAISTKTWNSNQRGPSGEPLSDIGLAGSHAYAVLRVFALGDRLMVTVRNPWGHMGMKYDRANRLITSIGNFLEIPVLDRVRIEEPEFDIDIEDVIRFFANIYMS